MKPDLACSDFTFPLLPHRRALQLIASLEFKGVDIGLFEGRSHLWPSREFADLRRSSRGLREALDATGLKPADVFLQLGNDFRTCAINHREKPRRKRAREVFQRTLEYTAACGGQHVTLLPGVAYEGEPYRSCFARSADELAWRVEQAQSFGLVLAVEPHLGSLIAHPRQAHKLVQTVPGLTLTLDYTHFVCRGVPETAVEPLVVHASHFHVRGACRRRLQVSFQKNEIDYARVLRAMRACSYSGWIGIEYVWIDWERCNECDTVSETILFRDFIRSHGDRRLGRMR